MVDIMAAIRDITVTTVATTVDIMVDTMVITTGLLTTVRRVAAIGRVTRTTIGRRIITIPATGRITRTAGSASMARTADFPSAGKPPVSRSNDKEQRVLHKTRRSFFL